jgi:PAS domain S-box-containing protein
MGKENTGMSGLVLDATGLVAGKRTRQASARAARLLLTALIVGVAYYAGVWIGLTTAFPGPDSARRHLFWPPNVILLAALLVTPPRWWWPWSLTAFAAHLLAHTQLGLAPAVMALPVQFAGNLFQAVLAALALRRLSDTPWRLDTLRSMIAVIVVAGVAAPALVSALVIYVYVWAGWMQDYASAWSVRFLANAVSTITLAPLLFPIAGQGMRGLRAVGLRGAAEFVAVLAGLLIVGASVVQSTISSAQLPLLYAPVPMLLWFAVRFGPPGLCIGLVSTVLLFVHQGTTVTQVPGNNNIITVVIFLVAVAVPLLLLSAVVQERRTKEEALTFSEARYRAVVEDQTELICRFLPDGTYTFVNDAYCSYFQRSREELLGGSFWSFLPPEGHQASRAFLASITPERPIATTEHKVLGPDGEIRWQQWRDRGFFDDQGQLVEYQAVGRDITERKQVEARLNTQYVITRILSESASMADATPRILQTICEQLDCEYGEFWRINREANVLNCVEIWHLPLKPLTEFESTSRPFVFPRGLGLPGRVWQTGKPICMPDVTVDPDFLRAAAAASAGLHGTLGFPILSGDEVLGVIVLFAREIREAGKDRLEMMTSIGSQIGQFIERRTAEERNNELVHRLGERVKELTALHGASRILQNEQHTTEEWLQQLVVVLPPAWQYPEVTAARVQFGELEFATPNFRRTPWTQRVEFSITGGLRGTIEVVYLEERPSEQEGPFLSEERYLIDSLAEMLRAAIERRQAAQLLRENEAVLRASYDRIQDLAGRLITAQEAERSRIAGELHDDVNQQLAGLSIALSNVKRQLQNGGDGSVQQEITRLQRRTIDLADMIRNLSHELHPGVLQHAGLVAALNGHCAEVGRQYPIEVTFSAVDVLDSIPQEIALCLYRVAQEALRNIADHAAARKAQVTLRASEHNLELVIADDGQGFSVAEARRRGGLGLISLDERVRLVGGNLTIDTKPQRGTEVRVQVPLGGSR